MDYMLILVNFLSIFVVLGTILINYFKLNFTLPYYSLMISIIGLTVGMSINLYNHNKNCQEVNFLRVLASGIIYSITIFSIIASNYFLKFSGNQKLIFELILITFILCIYNYINVVSTIN